MVVPAPAGGRRQIDFRRATPAANLDRSLINQFTTPGPGERIAASKLPWPKTQ
jgi:hypothetical protein